MKKLVCVLLAMLLLVGCGGEAPAATTADTAAPTAAVPTGVLADGSAVTLSAWEQPGLPTQGDYYLTADVELTAPMVIDGQLRLHLNGHRVSGASGVDFGSLITVAAGGALTLFDEGEGAVVSPRSITAKPYVEHLVLVEGTLTLMGGTLDASTVNVEDVANGACVYVADGGRVEQHGGTLVGGTVWCQSLQPKPPAADPTETTEATEPTGATEATEATEPAEPETAELLGKGGTVYLASGAGYAMTGGTVMLGSAGLGGNFYVEESATLTLSGGLVTEGESLFNGGNIYLAGVLEAKSCEIALGRAYNHGGNLYVKGQLVLDGVTVREGRCDAGGVTGKRGGNLLVNGLEATVEITGCSFLDGDGTGKENFGGNISVIGQCAREITITDTTISGGIGHRGGNVYFGTLDKDVDPENLDMYMKNVTISGGRCTYRGNNLCMDSDLKGVYVNITMDNCAIVQEELTGETVSLGAGAAGDTWATLTMNGGKLENGTVTLYADAVFTTNGTDISTAIVGGQGQHIHTP